MPPVDHSGSSHTSLLHFLLRAFATNGQQVVTEQVLEEQEQGPSPENMELGTVERAVEEFVNLDESEDDTPDIALSSTAGADCNGLGEEVVAATSAEVIQENGDGDANQDDTEPWPERSPGIQLAPPGEDGGPEYMPTMPPVDDSGSSHTSLLNFLLRVFATNEQQVVTEQVLEEQEQGPSPENMELGTVERAVEEFVDLDKSEDDTPDIALSSTAGADCNGLGEEVVAATSAEVIQENGDGDANQDDTEPWPERSPGIQLAPPGEDGGPEVSGPAPKTPAPSASKAHVFFFDRASQEEEPPQPACDPPFTPAQLEEARQQLRYLMKESGQGLDSVTKALLKNSGDVEAALQYLRHGPQGYLWDPRDDLLLCSGGHFLHILEQKYGKAAVARRIYFLDIQFNEIRVTQGFG
ncbi:hypothetical protein ANANG_G00014950 [Anguilla anguilla]|uniref:Telomeric repeat-binding factor 2-interacting protein 1 n=1 Tax=Anguilla anguilla TaxID=7936 RepID=A0A9D3SBJ9_ANGAN|nr:hypothetical protein ANANG_G00014950 [Anguilla anguilla]